MRIGQFQLGCRGFRYAAVTAALDTALMRHFLALAYPPAHLSGGVPVRSAAGALIARAGAAARLPLSGPRTRTRTINVAVIATAADPHLHRTTPAVVEPIARLGPPLQCPSRNTGQCSGKAGIKGLHNRLSQALRTEGSGVRDVNLQTPGPRFFDLSHPSISQRVQHASRSPSQQDLLPPLAPDRATAISGNKESVRRTDTDEINQPRIARDNQQLQSAPITRKARVSTAINNMNRGSLGSRFASHKLCRTAHLQ